MHHSPPFFAPPRPSEPCPAPQSDGAGCAICCCCCETASWSTAPATQGCASPATQWLAVLQALAPSPMSCAAASATTCPGPARPRAPPHPLPPISPRAGRAPPDRGRAARTGARILPRPGRGCHTPPRHRHLGPAPARRRTAPGRPRKHLPRPCQIWGHFLAALAKEAPLSSRSRGRLSHTHKSRNPTLT